jgi:hypothetical protein
VKILPVINTPAGLPHVLSKDDTYGNYHFRANTIFHPNTWAMTRNPTLYPSPNTFNPARWLTPSYPTFRSPLSHYPSLSFTPMPIFGYGPRRCPGIHIAEKSLFIQAAYIGWACTLKLKPGVSIDEDELFATTEAATGIASGLGFASGMGTPLAPKRWDFDVLPRKDREQVVRSEALIAAELDPLGPGKGGRRRVERIAFKREGGWNPSF